MSALVADQLSFGWSPDELLFQSLSFTIDHERVALVGRNGVGKSTLIELVVGNLTPLGGHVGLPDNWLYLPQISDPALTIAQALNIADRLAALQRFEDGCSEPTDYEVLEHNWDIEERALALLKEFKVPFRSWAAPLSSLSGGQAMRLRLARVELEQPELLIMDEPTNDLDADGLDWLVSFVDGWSSGLLVVSHNRVLLSKVDRILELSTLGLKSYGGDFDHYREAKSQELASIQRRQLDAEKGVRHARKEAQSRRERTERRAALGKRTKTGSQPAIMIGNLKRNAEESAGKSQGLGERQIEEAQAQLDAVRQEVEVSDPLAFDIPSTRLPAGKRVLSVEDLSVRYQADDALALDGFSLNITGPERIAISGKNGSGKSTLLRAICGEVAHAAGEIEIGVDRFALLDQSASRSVPDRSLVEQFLHENPDVLDNQARAALARFGFRNTAAETSLRNLSGGERLRASLAIALMSASPPQLLILDEPTNHMDLESIATLERALNAYDGALIVVSHDQWFLDAIAIERTVTL